MNLRYLFFGLLIASALFEVFADVLFKKWALENKTLVLIIGLVAYGIGTIFWAFSLRYETLSKASVIFAIIALIMLIGVGVLYFDERLTFWNKIGIVMGLISVVLLQI